MLNTAAPQNDAGTMHNKNKETKMDSMFDENGIHKLEKYSKEIKTKVNIDFWEECVKIYVIVPQKPNTKNTDSLNHSMNDFLNSKINHLIISKKFKISDDYNSVTIEETVYSIPTFFNRTMVKNNDTKTWQMIFYQIFSDEVHMGLQRFKEQSKGNNDN